MEGVLKSWAVPRGPTLDPAVKRLAVMVEDHPFDYKDFEGIIPEGNYGAGSVIIWDRGTYRHPEARDSKESEALLLEGLKKGNLKFILAGEKLKGEFALVKTAQDAKSWLLLKKKDSWATTGDILSRQALGGLPKDPGGDGRNHPGEGLPGEKPGPDPPAGGPGRLRPGGGAGRGHAPPRKTHAGHPGERALRPPGLGLRGEVGRLPGHRRSPGGQGGPLQPQSPLSQAKICAHCGVPPDAAFRGGHRRRDHRGGRGGPCRFSAAAELPEVRPRAS